MSVAARQPNHISQTSATLGSVRSWKQVLAFAFGFCLQFDFLIGGNGEGAVATGGYGYRILDFAAFGIACLLGIHSLIPIYSERSGSFLPYRILPLALYSLFVGALFIASALSIEPRTAILADHYILYGVAALYLAVLLDDVMTLDRFCWGLIIGLLATVPIFLLQNSGWSETLLNWGMMAGYAPTFDQMTRERYSGMWAHPNEAAHVAALAAAAGAYFAFVRRLFLPLALVAGGFLAVFYYTWSRGGLIAVGATLAIPFVIPRGRATIFRSAVMLAILILAFTLTSQLDFVASRFGDDPNESSNLADRLDSTLSGLQILLTHPLGMSIYDFITRLGSTTGVWSPHNGFIFFAGIFGLLPLAILLMAIASNFRVQDDVDIFFALLTLQISVSFMFEQLPGCYPYAFAICMIGARAFTKTRIGRQMLVRQSRSSQKLSADFSNRKQRASRL
jgi:hypothetical protein